MYLISIYFDEETNRRLQWLIDGVAKYTGNKEMLLGNVPPHITIAAFWADSEECARNIFRNVAREVTSGEVQWVSPGCFLPQVLYVAPVLNEYLHQLSVKTYKEASIEKDVQISRCYQPFAWFPHTTVAKRLSTEQMAKGFENLQKHFVPFKGIAAEIGLAKTNPYTNLEQIVLK